MAARVDIGVVCNYAQSYEWWSSVLGRVLAEQKSGEVDIGRIHTSGTALPDQGKNGIIASVNNRRLDLTDVNRVKVAGKFLEGDADWLMWLDDDTVPPKGFLSHLLSLKRDFVGGLYFLGAEPYNPIAYIRQENGLYKSINKYSHGALIQVDSIGMGCTLIHRSVFERIMDGHTLYQRPNGTLVPVPNDEVEPYAFHGSPPAFAFDGANYYQVTPLSPLDPDDDRSWPFYAMEHVRTEDHYFCELAANVGIKPYLDTLVVCKHLKIKAISREDHLEYHAKREAQGS